MMDLSQPELQNIETGINQTKEELCQSFNMDEIDWSEQYQKEAAINDNNQLNGQKPINPGSVKLEEQITNFNKKQINNYLSNLSFAPPRFHDIQRSLQILRKAFPQTFTDRVVNDLLKNLIKKMNNQPIWPEEQVQLHQAKSKQYQGSKLSYIPKRHYRQRMSQNYPLKHCNKGINQARKIIQQNIQTNPLKGIAGRLQSIWNQQFQGLLLSLYKKGHQFSFIRDHFQEQYPKFRQIFCVNSLRGKFYKIIRQTIRKLFSCIEQIGRQKFPNMIRLPYNIIQNIMYFQEGRYLRMLLVDLYFCKDLNQALVDRIIDSIISFVRDTKDQHADYRLIDF